MAAMNEPAETAMRVNTLRAEPARGRGRPARARGSRSAARAPGGLLDPADGLVVDWPREPVGARIATGELVPQSRGSQAVVALLDPQPGERVLDLCAGPGDQDDRDRGPARRTAARSSRSSVDPRRAAEIEALCARAGRHAASA